MQNRLLAILFLGSGLLTQCWGTSGSLWADSAEFLVTPRSNWRFHAAVAPPGPGWNRLDFDDRSWPRGEAGFGYGDDDDRTVLARMRGRYTAVYLRKRFQVDSVKAIEQIYLYVNFDDGFIAYLNGKPVASAQAVRLGDRVRVGSHEASGYVAFRIENANQHLVAGENLIAIEGHNRDLNSSDFTLDPFLTLEPVDIYGDLFDGDDLRADLDYFETRLRQHSSYRYRGLCDDGSLIAQLRGQITDRTPVDEFARELHKLVMQLGDCHAYVDGPQGSRFLGIIPMRIADTQQGVVALSLARRKLLHADYPYLEEIDGLPVDDWIEVAARYAPRGSPQLIRRRALERLGEVELLRHEMGRKASPTVDLTFRSADQQQHQQRFQRLRITRQSRFSLGRLQLGAPRRLEGDIGYLRIPVMDDRLIPMLVRHLNDFRDCEGWIIDVRDNPGGRYGNPTVALRILGPGISNSLCHKHCGISNKPPIRERPH